MACGETYIKALAGTEKLLNPYYNPDDFGAEDVSEYEWNDEAETRSRLHDLKDSKICDYDMIHYIHKFLTDNDQLPPADTIATNFCVSKNAVVLRLKRLQKHGVLDRNDVNKLKFNREYLKSIIVA